MIDLDELERLWNTPNPHEPDSVCDGFDEAVREAFPTLIALARAGSRLADACESVDTDDTESWEEIEARYAEWRNTLAAFREAQGEVTHE
jgi:inactivated superfamily I helicase